MLVWCGERDHNLCLIETMPLGAIDRNRTDQHLPLSLVRARLRQRWTLQATDYQTGGPARYFDVVETGTRVGFITPMTHNFCEGCNRVRLTCTGTLYMCLGQDDAADLRRVLRDGVTDVELDAAIRLAIAGCPGTRRDRGGGCGPARGRWSSGAGPGGPPSRSHPAALPASGTGTDARQA